MTRERSPPLRNQNRYGTTPFGDFDFLPRPDTSQHPARMLLQASNPNAFHVRHQGSAPSPTFIFAFNSGSTSSGHLDGSWYVGDPGTSEERSNQPTGLSTNAEVQLSGSFHEANNVYNGPTTLADKAGG